MTTTRYFDIPTNADEDRRAARLAAAKARRAERPTYEEIELVGLRNVEVGDFVLTMGGKGGLMPFKKYSADTAVKIRLEAQMALVFVDPEVGFQSFTTAAWLGAAVTVRRPVR